MTSPAASRFVGFVLAGGASRRMGRDKAFVEVDGRPLVRGVVDALHAAGARTVTVIGGDRDRLEALGLHVRDDGYPDQGPLGGIVTALAEAGGATAMVLSCDLVDPSPSNVRAVADALAEPGDVVVPMLHGRPQWLHAAWGPACGAVVGAHFDAGERTVAAALGGLRVVEIDVPEPERLHDADTPDDLSTILGERGDDR